MLFRNNLSTPARLLVALSCLFLGVSAVADEPSSSASKEQKKTFTSDVKVVNVLATVRDKKGHIVTALNRDDFQLEEDGKPQNIRYFAHDTELPLTLGVLIDTSMNMRSELEQERNASATFVDKVLRPEKDRVFLIHFDRQVELLQDLTGSQQSLRNALQKLEPASVSDREEDGSRRNGTPRSGDADDRGSGSDSARRPYRGATLYDAVFLASDEVLNKQQGRKAVVVVSDGVDRGSKITLERAVEAAQRADTLVYTIYVAGEQPEHANRGAGRGGTGRGRGGMGGGIGLPFPGGGYPGRGGGGPGGRGRYPGDDEPGDRGSDRSQERANGRKILERIAQETGGSFFTASKKEPVDQIYARIEEELRNQYNLGYTPERGADSAGYHRIVLTTKKTDLQVQARHGYYSDK